MALSDAVQQIVGMNVVGRVFCSCRAHGIREPARIAYYTRAVELAVVAELTPRADPSAALGLVLTEQLVLLEAALAAAAAGRQRVPDRSVNPARASAESALADPGAAHVAPEAASALPPVHSGTVDAKSMEEKLQAARKPLRKLLREDCVTLGLVTPERAEALVCGLAGRTRETAELDIVAELRNNLHGQVRSYIRKHKGGPWPSPKSQEELRLDIVGTATVHSLLMLARQTLRERSRWESEQSGGALSSLLGGKLLLGLTRRN